MGMPTATVQMKGPDGIARIGVGVGTGEARTHLGGGAEGQAVCGSSGGHGMGGSVGGHGGREAGSRQAGKLARPSPRRGELSRPGFRTRICGMQIMPSFHTPTPSSPRPPLTGPVDAAYKAVDSLVRVEAELSDYSVSSVTQVRRGPGAGGWAGDRGLQEGGGRP